MATRRKERVKRTISRELKHVSPSEAQEIVTELKPELKAKAKSQPVERVPGLTIAGSKTTYTYRDLCEMFPIVSFIPEETIPLTFQGVSVQAIEGLEMHVPECYKRIYDNHRKALREAGKSLISMGYPTIIELGAWALPARETE